MKKIESVNLNDFVQKNENLRIFFKIFQVRDYPITGRDLIWHILYRY